MSASISKSAIIRRVELLKKIKNDKAFILDTQVNAVVMISDYFLNCFIDAPENAVDLNGNHTEKVYLDFAKTMKGLNEEKEMLEKVRIRLMQHLIINYNLTPDIEKHYNEMCRKIAKKEAKDMFLKLHKGRGVDNHDLAKFILNFRLNCIKESIKICEE